MIRPLLAFAMSLPVTIAMVALDAPTWATAGFGLVVAAVFFGTQPWREEPRDRL